MSVRRGGNSPVPSSPCLTFLHSTALQLNLPVFCTNREHTERREVRWGIPAQSGYLGTGIKASKSTTAEVPWTILKVTHVSSGKADQC